MIKNNKGFMLAEVIFVSVVVMTTMLALYKSYTRIYKLYNERSNYYDIDGIYIIKTMTDSLIKNGQINNLLSNNEKIKYLIKSSECNLNNNENNTICTELLSLYNIQNMLIVNKNNIVAENDSNEDIYLENPDLNKTFENYLKFINNKLESNKENTDNINYLIIIEYENNEKLYYSSLKLR